LVVVGYLLQPSDYDIEISPSNCEPIEGLPWAREKVNSYESWRLQTIVLDKAIKSIEKSLSEPNPLEELLKKIETPQIQPDAELEKFYTEYPSYRPSKEELEVAALRARADKLESKHFREKMVKDMRLSLINKKSDYSKCLYQLKALQNSKIY
jgi:hypothetical protein